MAVIYILIAVALIAYLFREHLPSRPMDLDTIRNQVQHHKMEGLVNENQHLRKLKRFLTY